METFTFRLYQGGKEVHELAMSIEATGLASAKARFQSLWLACPDDAEVAVLLDASGRIVWGVERGQAPPKDKLR